MTLAWPSLEEGKRLLTAHHISNILLCLTFYLTKVVGPICQLVYGDNANCFIEGREYQILLFLAVVITLKNKRATSWLHYLQNVFMFTKIANLVMFYLADPMLALFYGIVVVVLMVVIPEPAYKGPQIITFFRGVNLHDELQRDKRNTWLIEFYASWAPACAQVAHTFAEVSLKYSLPNLKFGKIDIGRYTKEGERFRINTHVTSRQLPTIILFEDGKEIMRRPLVSKDGRALRFTFSAENIARDFDLNTLYESCKKFGPKQKRVVVDPVPEETSPTEAGDVEKKEN